MLNKIISILMLGLMVSCSVAPAYAKGYSGGSRGGYSRSYSRPAPRQVTINKTTVVHEHNGGSSGNSLLTGMLVGSMLSNNSNSQQPVVVEQVPTPQVIQAQPVETVSTVSSDQHQNESHAILWFIIAVTTAGFFLILHKQNKDKYNA